jgi:hypothetical protein
MEELCEKDLMSGSEQINTPVPNERHTCCNLCNVNYANEGGFKTHLDDNYHKFQCSDKGMWVDYWN